MARPERPDFIIIGAPKAGTTALHSALAQHPEVFTTTPKEPKYWLCGDAPPPHWIGPGDAHSQQEWIWRRRDYDALFRPAAEHQVRGESTPFYLWSYPAHRRIAEHLPDVKLIAVVRDPIDRAYSNWMHLWSDGLEREPDFERAFAQQRQRIDAGWAPFWRYQDLGLYGRQLEHLYRYVDRAAGARGPLPRHRRDAGADRRRGVPVPRHLREPRRRRSRATTRAPTPSPAGAPRCSAAPCGPAPGSGSSPRPRSGGAASVPLIAQLSSRRVTPAEARRPRRAPGCCRTSRRTSRCSAS